MKYFLLALLFSSPSFAAKVYQWRDADGHVYYSDQPAVGQNVRERPIRVPSNNASQAQASMILFVTPECGQPCADAVALLDSRNISYELKNPNRTEQQMIEFINLVGSLSVRTPVLLIGKQVLSPWDKLIWGASLSKAGFPPVEKKNMPAIK